MSNREQADFFLDLDTPDEIEKNYQKVVEYIEIPKIVTNSIHCPDCKSKVKLRPDGVMECPNCVIRVPYATVYPKEKSNAQGSK